MSWRPLFFRRDIKFEESAFGWPWIVCIVCRGAGTLGHRQHLCCWACRGSGVVHLSWAVEKLPATNKHRSLARALLAIWERLGL